VTWIYALPIWLLAPLTVIVGCTVSLTGLRVARSLIKRRELIPQNDVAGSIFGLIGTVLAVALSFMFINVWSQYVLASNTVQLEASAVSDLHHIADSFPEPTRSKLQDEVDRYVQLVIYDEWPKMRSGGHSDAAHNAAYAVQSVVAAFKPKTSVQVMLQSHALDSTNIFLDARRMRLHENDNGIPTLLWETLLFVSCVTIIFSYYFRVDKPFEQYFMIVALTSVIAVMMLLIADLDYPFRGQTGISPAPWQHTWNSIHNLQGGY
jgi:CDP-diglyceride synthetase